MHPREHAGAPTPAETRGRGPSLPDLRFALTERSSEIIFPVGCDSRAAVRPAGGHWVAPVLTPESTSGTLQTTMTNTATAAATA